MAKLARGMYSSIAALLLILSAIGAGIGSSASAQAAGERAYLYADQPSADSYTPFEDGMYNSTGGTNTIVRTGVGAYTVSLPGMNNVNASVHLTAGSGSVQGSEFVPGTTCEISKTAVIVNGGVDQFVVCANGAGEPVDSAFSLLHNSGVVFLGAHGAYLWANDPSAESYTPNEDYQYNSTNQMNTITRSDVGHYEVTLAGLADHFGNFQVSATRSTTTNAVLGVSCGVYRGGVVDGVNRGVTVMCADRAGAATDSGFMLLYTVGVKDANTEALVSGRGGYAFASLPELSTVYDAGTYVTFNSNGNVNRIKRTDVGAYTITFAGVGSYSGHVQVTAWGTAYPGVYCSVSRWDVQEGAKGLDFIVEAVCFDSAGNAADSFLWATYLAPQE